MRRFEGRVAFVTGAAHGIGRAIVQRLAAEGASVVLADIETTTAEQVRSGLEKQGASGLVVACDITDRAAVDDAIARTLARFDRLDVLVNNAGGSVRIGEFEQTTMADWHRQLDVTLIGAVHAVQAALPHLLRVRGNVVSVASVNGLAAFGEPAYSAAKAGLVNLTRNLAVRYGAQGLRFNVVAPGTVRTRNWDDQPGALERLASIVPLGRVGEPADIAAAVAYLASDDAAWVTGTTLTVDGGVLAGPFGGRRYDDVHGLSPEVHGLSPEVHGLSPEVHGPEA